MEKVINKEVLYIGDVGKKNTAMSIHAQNIAKIFGNLGYHTTFICDGNSCETVIENSELFEYFYTKKYIHIPKLSTLEWLIDELTGWKYRALVKEKVEAKKPKLILMYGYAAESWLIEYSHKNNIPLIVERVDWFEKSDRINIFEREILQKKVDNTILKLDKRVDGVISISTYFQRYYDRINIPTIFIPPVFEFNNKLTIKRFEGTEKLRLIYAGSVGGSKDSILPALKVIKKINENGILVHFDLVGPSVDEIENLLNMKNLKKFGIIVHGKVTNEKAKEIIKKADYSILLRQNKRYAKAGFSTKFAESMSLGVPVICTKVGGADSFITNMKDGVLVENNSVETIEKVLYALINTHDRDILNMKINAYKTAIDLFNINSYSQELKEFVARLEGAYE